MGGIIGGVGADGGHVVPRREFGDTVDGMAGGDADQYVAQIGEGLDATEATSFDDAGHQCPMHGPTVATGEKRIADRELLRADGALDGVGVHFDAAVGQEAAKVWPARQAITDSLGQAASAGDEFELLLEPGFEVIHQRPRAFLSNAQAHIGGAASDFAFNGVKLGISSQGFGGDRRIGRFVDIVKITACVDVTLGKPDAAVRLGQAHSESLVIGPIAVAMEDSSEPGQMIDGIVMTSVVLVDIGHSGRTIAHQGRSSRA